MNIRKLLIGILFFCPTFISAQYLEIGISSGFAQYFGDLQSGFDSRENHVVFGVLARYNQSRRLSFKAQFSQMTLSGKDANQKSFDAFEFNRNLSFQSKLYELNIQAEFNLSRFDIRDGKTTSPYLFAGIAAFFYNPKAELDGQWHDLQPLGTEGQTLDGGSGKYSKINIALPLGGGLKINLSERINLGFEFGIRLTFSDYLDDVSGQYPDLASLEIQNPIARQLSFRTPELLPQQAGNPIGKPRGDPNNKDGYFIGGITLTFNLAEKYDLEFDEHFKKFSPNYQQEKVQIKENLEN